MCFFSSHSFWTSSSLDVPAGVTQEEGHTGGRSHRRKVTQEEGHTGGRSHRIFHPPSFCGACLNFSREKDSASLVDREVVGILCTHDLIVLHLLGIDSLILIEFSHNKLMMPKIQPVVTR